MSNDAAHNHYAEYLARNETIEVVGEPMTRTYPKTGVTVVRAVVRITLPPSRFTTSTKPRITFGLAHKSGDGWVVRDQCKTLRKAQELFDKRYYP